MRDAVFLLLTMLTMAVAIGLAAASVAFHIESLSDPALLVLLALGGGFALWGVLEDHGISERSPRDF